MDKDLLEELGNITNAGLVYDSQDKNQYISSYDIWIDLHSLVTRLEQFFYLCQQDRDINNLKWNYPLYVEVESNDHRN